MKNSGLNIYKLKTKGKKMQSSNYKQVQRVLFIILVANFLVAILKIVMGNIIKSSSMSADGFHSLSDGSSNIVAMIGIYFASKPEDKKHPYGHDKIEIITGLLIGIFLIFVWFNVVFEAIEKLKNPLVPSITLSSLAMLLITLIINIFVTVYEHRQGVKLGSNILISDATHTKSDIFVTIGVLITLLSVKLGMPPILDTIVSFVVAGVIFFTAWEVLSENGNILIDAKAVDENKIREIIVNMENVKGVHKIRSRGTQNNTYIDMHILANPDITLEQSHILSHKIEKHIQENINKNAHVLVHIEPYYEK